MAMNFQQLMSYDSEIIMTIETIPALNQTFTEYDSVASAPNTFGLAVVIFSVGFTCQQKQTKYIIHIL